MSRYIDEDKLLQKLSRMIDFCEKHKVSGLTALFQVGDAIMDCPTADVVEVRHGEWIEKDDGWDGVMYTCSACNCDWTTIDGTPFENNMRYCPECGAKMDGERREENDT